MFSQWPGNSNDPESDLHCAAKVPGCHHGLGHDYHGPPRHWIWYNSPHSNSEHIFRVPRTSALKEHHH